MGIAYVYTFARDNLPEYDFLLIDAMGQMVEHSNMGMERNWEMLINRVKDINPDVIGIGAYYFKGASLFHETCNRIKEVLPDVLIVAGGNYPTDTPEKVLNDLNVDFIIVSEGEGPFSAFLQAYFNGNDVAHLTDWDIGYQMEIIM